MRYIGNKTRLLPFLLRTIRDLGLEPGRVHDAFAGTCAVGRALHAAGWRVTSSDIMTYSYVFQRAYIAAPARPPGWTRLAAAEPLVRRRLKAADAHSGEDLATRDRERIEAVADHLALDLEPEEGFVTRHFAPAGGTGRMYFTDDNARRIDAARHALHRWHRRGLVSDDAFHALLAGVIEGADRVANTAGVYAAYIKTWQPNALRPFSLALEPHGAPGPRPVAHLGDAAEAARTAGPVDLLYVDPPYNTRQYPAYYHIPEIIARGWFERVPNLRGKTGLLVHGEFPRSDWNSRRRAPRALRELLAATSARHVLVSYNTEGVIRDADLQAALADAAVDGEVRRFSFDYRRYRSDSDRDGRRYRTDSLDELLYHARLR